jgi:hypothetical protein
MSPCDRLCPFLASLIKWLCHIPTKPSVNEIIYKYALLSLNISFILKLPSSHFTKIFLFHRWNSWWKLTCYMEGFVQNSYISFLVIGGVCVFFFERNYLQRSQTYMICFLYFLSFWNCILTSCWLNASNLTKISVFHRWNN